LRRQVVDIYRNLVQKTGKLQRKLHPNAGNENRTP